MHSLMNQYLLKVVSPHSDLPHLCHGTIQWATIFHIFTANNKYISKYGNLLYLYKE